jgi:hypothetical protein
MPGRPAWLAGHEDPLDVTRPVGDQFVHRLDPEHDAGALLFGRA